MDGKGGMFKKPGKVLYAIVGAVVVLVVVCIVAVTHKTVINLNDYLTVSYDGYNTVGHASYSFDSAALEKDYGSKIKLTSDGKKQLGELSGLADATDAALMVVEESVGGELDKSDKLSNGDEVNFKWDIDEDALKYVNCKLKYSDQKFTVSDLKDAETVDVFDGVTVEFTGTAPNGAADIVNNANNEIAQNFGFSLDKSDGLSNGDEVVLSLQNYSGTDDIASYCAENYGMIPKETEKTFKVEGLPSYATKLSEISDDIMAKMKQQVEDEYNAMMAANGSNYIKSNSLDYAGAYFLTSKAGNTNTSNRLILVYKANATVDNTETKFKDTFDYYYAGCFDNIMILPDGTCSVDLSQCQTPNDSFTVGKSWFDAYYFSGYEKLDTLVNKLVTANINNYTYEKDIKDEAENASATASTSAASGTSEE